jgi:WD40 repeat protein
MVAGAPDAMRAHFLRQQQANNARLRDQSETPPPPGMTPTVRRRSKLQDLLDESPPMSPATEKRKTSKELMEAGKSGDVFRLLSINKDPDTLALEAEKRVVLERAAAKFLAIAQRRSRAEVSSSRWRSVAKLYKDGKLTLDHWESVVDPKPAAQHALQRGSKPRLDGPLSVEATWQPEWSQHSIVGTVEGAKACVATRWSKYDDLLACAYFDGCISVFDVSTCRASTHDVGCLRRIDGEWKETDSDDTSVALTSLRWGTGPNADFLGATATGGLLALYHAAGGQSRFIAALQDPGEEFYCLDWTADGTRIVAGGAGKVPKLFDPARMAPIASVWDYKFNGTLEGHVNRIGAFKCFPTDPSLVLTTGLDNTVQLWDLRSSKHVCGIAAGTIGGDCLDVDRAERYVLTSGQDQTAAHLDLWDLRNLAHRFSAAGLPRMAPHACGFSQDGEHIHVAGSDPTGQVQALVAKTPQLRSAEPCVAPLERWGSFGLDGAKIRALESAHRSPTVAYGNHDGVVTILRYKHCQRTW